MAETHQLTRREMRARERAREQAAAEAAAQERRQAGAASQASAPSSKPAAPQPSPAAATSAPATASASSPSVSSAEHRHHRHGRSAAPAASDPAQGGPSVRTPRATPQPVPSRPAPTQSVLPRQGGGSAFVRPASETAQRQRPAGSAVTSRGSRPSSGAAVDATDRGGRSSSPAQSRPASGAAPQPAPTAGMAPSTGGRKAGNTARPGGATLPSAAAQHDASAVTPSQPRGESRGGRRRPLLGDDVQVAPNRPLATGPATASVLVLPSTPEQRTLGVPLDSTGEVVVTTGSITLPQVTTDTGVIPAVYERDQGDPLADTSDSVPVTDETRPVSAVETVRRYESERILPQSAHHDRMNKVSVGLLVGAGVLLIAATVFVLLRIFG